jgi:thymidylate synthase (FAD)
MTTKLLELQGEGMTMIVAEQATDKRKKVRQVARGVLPNETEAIIVATGNVRAWRHIINMRANKHAEIEIRKAMFKVFLAIKKVDPISFSDMEPYRLPDGTYAVRTNYPKV